MKIFDDFFTSDRLWFLNQSIRLALAEDGNDLTSNALFRDKDQLHARIVCKQQAVLCGLPLISLILQNCGGAVDIEYKATDGEWINTGETVAELQGKAKNILKAERIILNFICHLSGIATYTKRLCASLENSGTKILDTRKTLPGLRYPQKYAVLAGGGENHRLNLEEMLMLKDNHIDRCGNITLAVRTLRSSYCPCPRIEVECRDEKEVREAAAAGVDRIMLDNMDTEKIRSVLPLIPPDIQTEISGNISADNIGDYARLGADFISMGSLTHSAPYADFSMRLNDANLNPRQVK